MLYLLMHRCYDSSDDIFNSTDVIKNIKMFAND